ncbi:autotransporter domain protein [Campylobacter pinnipediorum subsp. caledonicus]|uniref:Autotransporter domain protein n=1 Tax=Campylobacter pinnipediorum subsp. caledonicus TaxID=1874362 RepID=A0A1S6U9B5_9BACT|nr:autotransporter outer membrane beta-barrel domain-containing protein [Campylobacter pinnipediorum]AQW88336.1 autotransporter domain protein [Campylobacter pinnipediorum subsp. caledonicus]
MKISMIASATIIGAMITINAYGGSSLDEINNAQKEKSDLIKKLEEASKDGYLEKLKQEKEKIEKEKDQILKPQKEVEKLKEQAQQAKTAAEIAKEQRKAAEEAKKQAETKAFEKDGKTKTILNKTIEEQVELYGALQELNYKNFKGSKKDLREAIDILKGDGDYAYDKFEKLAKDKEGINNDQKIDILEKLHKIGLVVEAKFNELKLEKEKDKKKELTEELNGIIGNNNGEGLIKLIGHVRDEADNIKKELEKIITARDKIQEETNKITKQEKLIEELKPKLNKAQQELEQAKKEAEKALQDLEPKLEQAEKELKQAQELAKLAKDPEARKKALAELDEKLEKAKKDRAEAISSDKNLELNKDEAQTTSSLLSVVNNKEVENLLLNVKAKDIATLAKNINSTLEEVSKEFKDNKTVDTLLSSVGSAINSRLAKLSNPLNDDLALAYAIKNLSDNKFADNADTLSSVVKEYTNRFNYDSNLWGNIMGGKAKLKSQANTNTYGFMLGYDKAFDNMIIGGYAGYTNAKSSSNTLTTKSDNYHFGAYTRMYIDQNEIDAKVSYGKGKNKLDRKVTTNPDFDANGKYNTKFFDASIDYGHIFDTNNNSFMKPMIGLEYSHVSTKGFKETGKVPVSFKGTTVKTLSAKAAVEFRKYIANGNFLYITPGIQKELRKSMKDTELAFVNSTENIKYASKKDKHTFFTLKTGAEMKLTDNLSTNINFGVKAKSESKYYNGTVGLSYKF